jgi:colicin import membrane protein
MNQSQAARLALMGAALALAGCTTVLLPPNVTPVVAKTHSVDEAGRTLARVKAERAAVEVAYGDSEAICYTKFFVNDCLDAAKEKRRSALSVLRAVEVEAELFQRRAAVDQRDREVAQAIREYDAEETRMAALPQAQPRVAAEPAVRAPKPALAARRAKRAAKAAERDANAPAEAQKRAENVAAFEQRKREALERQKEIELKKAEKAAKAAAKASKP